MTIMESSAWNRWIRRLAWLPIPILLLVMAVLWAVDPSAVHEPPRLMMALNLLFSLPGALLVAYQAGRGFRLRGNLGLLGFGCGMLFWGSAGPVGGLLVPYGPDVVVAAHNTLIWLAAACHVGGMLLGSRQPAAIQWPEPWLAGAYTGALVLVVAVVMETLSGGMPVFFIQGEGGTPLRQIVLGSAIAMFLLTAVLLKWSSRDTFSGFQYWYVLALLLIAVGLFGVMIQTSLASALGWTGRIAQNLGGAYLLVAAFAGMRETRDWGHPLDAALSEARQRFEELINLAGDGIVMHERIGQTARGHFLLVNPAICALLGYTAEEMRELTPLDILAPEDRDSVAEDIQVMNRGGLLRHEKTLVARDGRRIPVDISTRQYRHQGRTMVISIIRDISERKQAEAAMRERTDRYELVLAGAQDAIWDWDVVNKRVHFSPQWKAMRGYAEDEVSDSEEEWSAGIHPDDAPRVLARLRDHFDGNTPVFAEEYRVRCKDGSWKWIFDRGIVRRDGGRRVVRMAGSESDITERKRVEEAIRDSEQLKQAVLDAMTAHVAVLDREGRIVAVNEPWRRFAEENGSEAGGLPPNTGIGINYLDICRAASGESAEGAREALDGIEAVLTGRTRTFSLEYPCHSLQAKRWFNLTVTPLGADRGGAVVSHIDITALRQLADQLRDERDRFTRIAATVPGVICSFRLRPDGSACFPYASPAIEDLYGLHPEELVASAAPLWAMIDPDDLGHVDAGITASALAMTPWRDEFRLRHPGKGEIWVEGHSMPVREPDGGILWHGYVQDVTERKQAERQLFASNERLKALMDALPVGVSFSDDVTCQRIKGNRMLLAQFEMTLQDNVSASAPDAMAAGRRVRYFHHGRELGDVDLPLQRAVAENRVIPPMELEVLHPNGRRWLAEVTGAPLHDAKAGVIGGLAVVVDITERKRAEEALRALLDEKEVLLREVHHRVKNNLAAIIDLLELQRESVSDLPAASRLADLRDRIKSMALIHEMLYQSSNLSRVDFHGYLQALAGHLHDSLDPHGAIRLHVTAPDIWMNLDTAIPCGLIVNELVTNALKYAFPRRQPQPGAEACEIRVKADWDGTSYTLTITDNGVGLPSSLDWTTTRTLGLRLVRMLGQHQLRGRITLDGAGGTRFSLHFAPRER